jgi:hypothetical protein
MRDLSTHMFRHGRRGRKVVTAPLSNSTYNYIGGVQKKKLMIRKRLVVVRPKDAAILYKCSLCPFVSYFERELKRHLEVGIFDEFLNKDLFRCCRQWE